MVHYQAFISEARPTGLFVVECDSLETSLEDFLASEPIECTSSFFRRSYGYKAPVPPKRQWNVGDFYSVVLPANLRDEILRTVPEEVGLRPEMLRPYPLENSQGASFNHARFDESPHNDSHLHYLSFFLNQILPAVRTPRTRGKVTEMKAYYLEELAKASQAITTQNIIEYPELIGAC